jgi:NAD(P)-dependent dehydrogenase (short-subunit alcohol dehydrogenase family)
MKHLVITGGKGNLGKTISHRLHEHGYHLHLAVRGHESVGSERLSHYSVDVSADDAAATWIEHLATKNELSAGIFLAGGFVAGDLLSSSMQQIREMVELNVATAFNLALPLLRHFRSHGGGRLIFMGARIATDPKQAVLNSAYSLSKLMLLNLAELINASDSSYHSSAHIILPGTLDTAANRELMPEADRSAWTSPDLIAETIENILNKKETRTLIPL